MMPAPPDRDLLPWRLPPLPGETEAALNDRRNRAMFEYQLDSTAEFWRRIGIDPNVAGARVLDLGCGHGVLTVDLARRGAREVVGLDLDTNAIEFARHYVPEAFPALSSRIQFVAHDIADLTGSGTFDFVFSKDAFEHILDLTGVVGHIHRLLKPGGRLILGTSPLYFSAFGDHDLLGRRIPWLTTLVPESLLYRFAAWHAGMHWRKASDAGLNKMTPAQFRSLFPATAWRIQQIEYNAGISSSAGSVLNVLRTIPFIEKHATVSIYTVIERI
jgi:SAM-dependent methyltransferase